MTIWSGWPNWAAAIELELPADLPTIATWTHEAVAANGCQDALIWLFALGPTVHAGPEVFIWPESPRTFAPEMFTQGVGAVSYHGERALPHAKSLNTLVNHLARVRALQAGEHEGLLVNRHGCVTEGSSSNLFVVQAGTLVTPPVEDVLAGVTQEEVLKLAARLSRSRRTPPPPPIGAWPMGRGLSDQHQPPRPAARAARRAPDRRRPVDRLPRPSGRRLRLISMLSFAASIRPDSPGIKPGDDLSVGFVTCANAGIVVHFFNHFD